MLTPKEITGLIQQTPMLALQQIHPRVQKAIEIDGETYILTLLVKDALDKGMKSVHIQNKYNMSRDFIYKIHFGKKRTGGPKHSNKKQ